MAITNFTILGKTIGRVANNAPTLGCGAIVVSDGQTLPDGDYVAVQLTAALPSTLASIVYNGAGFSNIAGSPVTLLKLSERVGTTMFPMNIKSCVVTGGDLIFYKRCNN
mgnify:CR=1 FL=1|tara:strand:+ start:3071 stop:3397 length:327 start_codon:yes stop_codon:yes gene_type:complete